MKRKIAFKHLKLCSLTYYSVSICEYVHAPVSTYISNICKSFGRKVSVPESKYIL
jgi:hypothetical protein